jgi:hypothetical protein
VPINATAVRQLAAELNRLRDALARASAEAAGLAASEAAASADLQVSQWGACVPAM